MNHPTIYFKYTETDKAKKLLEEVRDEFGEPGDRWSYESMDIIEGPNLWYIVFMFSSESDLTAFTLKYVKHQK